MRKTHMTDVLDRGAKRLLVMWLFIRDELEQELVKLRQRELDQAIQTELFKVSSIS
jgi:hypothetical protein